MTFFFFFFLVNKLLIQKKARNYPQGLLLVKLRGFAVCSKVLLFNRGSGPYSKSSRLGQWGTALATSTPELLCSEAPGLTGFWHQDLCEEWRKGCPKGHREGNRVSLGPCWIGAQEPQWEQEAATSCGLASHAEQEHGEGAWPLAWTPTSDFQARSKADHTFYRQWKDIRTFLCTETCSGGTYHLHGLEIELRSSRALGAPLGQCSSRVAAPKLRAPRGSPAAWQAVSRLSCLFCLVCLFIHPQVPSDSDSSFQHRRHPCFHISVK